MEFNRKQRFSSANILFPKMGDVVTVVSKNKGNYNYNTIWGIPQTVEVWYAMQSETDIREYYGGATFLSKTTSDGTSKIISKMERNSGYYYYLADYGAGKADYILTGNIYSFSVERDNKIIFDLIPCLNENGIPCFYDCVSKTTIFNELNGVCGYELLDGTYVAPQ